MAVYQAGSDGNAPSGLNPGDYVNTNGGMYMVASPGAYGSIYNPSSGYWSVKADGSSQVSNQSYLQSALNAASTVAESNTDRSQDMAREQMGFQKEQNARAMAFNSEEAQKNRSWQEMMSNTAHQREVKDLIAAGINPILTATGGSGAAVTSGATASGVTSSGAQGQVDTSYNNLVGGLISTMLNNQTSLDIAKLQAGIQQYVADSNRQATLGAAGTSAAALLGAANINSDTSKYINQQTLDRPNSVGGIARRGLESLSELIDSGINSAKGLFSGFNWNAIAGGRDLTAGKKK